MKKLIYTSIILLIFNSCYKKKHRVSFEIWNNNNNTINNLMISNGLNRIYIDSIESSNKKSVFLKFNNGSKTDGDYKLSFISTSKECFKNFGYFSNGIPTSFLYRLIIEKDTIIVKEIHK